MSKDRRSNEFYAKGNLVETSAELEKLKQIGFKNLEVKQDLKSKYPTMTYSIYNKKGKKVFKSLMLNDIFSFDNKKSIKGKVMHLLREEEQDRRNKKLDHTIIKEFEAKETVFFADIKKPEVFKVKKDRYNIKIIVPDTLGRLINKKTFGMKLNRKQLKEFKKKKTQLQQFKFIQRLSKDVEVNQKTRMRRGAKFIYSTSKKRLEAGDSVAVVMTYDLQNTVIKKYDMKHTTGRVQSSEYPNTTKGRNRAKVEAFRRLKRILNRYGISNAFPVLKSFNWTYRYMERGRFIKGKRQK